MLAVADRRGARPRRAEQALERGLAFDERQLRQVAPVEMQQVEHIVYEALAVLGFQRLLQHREVRNAALVLDYDFPVDERGLRRQLGDRGGDVRELVGPVEALAGEQAHLTMVETRLD